MPVTLNIIENTTELGQEVVTITLASASEPGPAGPGVPTGGTDGQVLTKTSATDYATAWEDPTGGGGGGAPTDVDYLVGTASGDLDAEIVVGTSPGGELGGTWAAPTVDATHSGSSHAGIQAAAEATAAAALAAHEADTTSIHGIANTANLYSVGGADVAIADGGTGASTAAGARANLDLEAGTDFPALATFNDHSARHENGGADEISLAGLDGTPTDLQTHLDDATAAHAGSAISVDSTNLSGTGTTVQASLEELDNLLDDHSSRHENGGADEISIAGLDGTPTELTNHLNDATDAHDASAISVADSGANYTATDVEGVLAEIAPQLGGGGATELDYTEITSSVSITATTEGAADTVVSAGAIVFDGSTRICIEFYSPLIQPGATASSQIAVLLYDGSSSIGFILVAMKDGTSTAQRGTTGCLVRRFLTPSAASHTYSIRAFRVVSNGTVVAGAGGSGDNMPAYIRITTA